MQKITGRNYGIDALRLWSMLLIVMLHVLGQGGVLANADGVSFRVSWLVEIIAYCAVNCYALVSGYVGYTEEERPYRYSKYLKLWLQVVCYSFGMTLAAFILRPDVIDLKTLICSLFPVATCHYWYFTAYTALFFFIPSLNRMLRAHSERQLNGLVFLILVLFSVYTILSAAIGTDPFKLGGGYSMLWLMSLYIVGAWLKKCGIVQRISTKKAWAALILSVLITWIGKAWLPEKTYAYLLVSYVSPTVIIMAIAYLVLFSRMRVSYKSAKLIEAFAPAAFGVYLIHTQKAVWSYLLQGAFSRFALLKGALIPLAVTGSALAIFIICILIEKLRMYLFKILKIDALSEKIGTAIQNAVTKKLDRL